MPYQWAACSAPSVMPLMLLSHCNATHAPLEHCPKRRDTHRWDEGEGFGRRGGVWGRGRGGGGGGGGGRGGGQDRCEEVVDPRHEEVFDPRKVGGTCAAWGGVGREGWVFLREDEL
ncbi:hypothetical protein B0H10DRAFT_1970391 [Mycena sp. CBHHK59/15]|nr:hypothetical protein B0H10DRAFT_1970391 [Mycena sp. CBHHK59/15]